MPSRRIAGEIRQGHTPYWLPLERALGSDELCGHFMWMADIELETGVILNAYKHRWTRRYIHLANDGRAFWYVGDQGYRRIGLAEAIEAAFVNWECIDPTRSEKAALRAAVRRARSAKGGSRGSAGGEPPRPLSG